MIPSGLIRYTRTDIECRAREFLLRRPDVPLTAPIDLELLIESHPSMTLIVIDGLRRNFGVEGCVMQSWMSKEIRIGVDYSVYKGPWPAYYEALGEEIGHVVLHKALFHGADTEQDFIDLQNDPEWSRYERDAKFFGECIRMPPSLLAKEAEELYKQVICEAGFCKPWQSERIMCSHMAHRFAVRPDEILKRLSDSCIEIRDRFLASIACRSDFLVPSSWTIKASNPHLALTRTPAQELWGSS